MELNFQSSYSYLAATGFVSKGLQLHSSRTKSPLVSVAVAKAAKSQRVYSKPPMQTAKIQATATTAGSTTTRVVGSQAYSKSCLLDGCFAVAATQVSGYFLGPTANSTKGRIQDSARNRHSSSTELGVVVVGFPSAGFVAAASPRPYSIYSVAKLAVGKQGCFDAVACYKAGSMGGLVAGYTKAVVVAAASWGYCFLGP